MLYLVPGLLGTILMVVDIIYGFLLSIFQLFFRLLSENIKKKNLPPLVLPQPSILPPFSHKLY